MILTTIFLFEKFGSCLVMNSASGKKVARTRDAPPKKVQKQEPRQRTPSPSPPVVQEKPNVRLFFYFL